MGHRRQPGDGGWTYLKENDHAPPGFFEAEAAGLRWLAETDTVLVPDVAQVGPHSIAVTGIDAGPPTIPGARKFGQRLARLHGPQLAAFGAPWSGFIGPLPMDNADSSDWASFYKDRRVLPFLRQARDRAAVDEADVRIIEEAMASIEHLPGADEGPRLVHGDLWSGNLVWDRKGDAWVIDPAAHGAHRESDLALLALFGAPYLAEIVASYEEQSPLADGWHKRVGLHQLHPLLVHAVLFGPSYGRQATDIARQRSWE